MTLIKYFKNYLLKIIGSILGIAWFCMWAIGGSYILNFGLERNNRLMELLLPGYFIFWVASLFIGRAAISSVGTLLLRHIHTIKSEYIPSSGYYLLTSPKITNPGKEEWFFYNIKSLQIVFGSEQGEYQLEEKLPLIEKERDDRLEDYRRLSLQVSDYKGELIHV